MAVSLSFCAEILTRAGVRHHVDPEEHAVRIMFVTRMYLNPRGEQLAIVKLQTPDDGTRCRLSIERAFASSGDPSALCHAACSLAATTPAVHAEFDADFDNLRMVVETVVEDGSLTPLQLMSMVDRLVEAAEEWAGVMAIRHRAGRSAA